MNIRQPKLVIDWVSQPATSDYVHAFSSDHSARTNLQATEYAHARTAPVDYLDVQFHTSIICITYKVALKCWYCEIACMCVCVRTQRRLRYRFQKDRRADKMWDDDGTWHSPQQRETASEYIYRYTGTIYYVQVK